MYPVVDWRAMPPKVARPHMPETPRWADATRGGRRLQAPTASSTDHDGGSANSGDQVLLSKTEGEALRVVHLSARSAEAEAWRFLRAEYVGTPGGRLAAMVRAIVYPREQWSANAPLGKDFVTPLTEWEIKVAVCE